jgi:hypothetical protein
MKYLLLICEDPSLRPADPADQETMMKEYATFTEAIVASGELAAGDRLHGIDAATSVRIRDGKRTLVDGPFAETTEHIGGYYIVDVADLDRAVDLAAQIPAARTGVVEVRPIWEM